MLVSFSSSRKFFCVKSCQSSRSEHIVVINLRKWASEQGWWRLLPWATEGEAGQGFWHLTFSYRIFSDKECFFSFEWVKLNFTHFWAPSWKKYFRRPCLPHWTPRLCDMCDWRACTYQEMLYETQEGFMTCQLGAGCISDLEEDVYLHYVNCARSSLIYCFI